MKNDFSLEDFLNGSKKTISRKLPVVKRTLQDELSDIDQWLKEYKEVFYVYDSFITNKEYINRLKNWYFPHHKLITLDGATNKSTAIYLLQKIKEGERILPSFIPLQRFTITNHLNYISPSNYFKINKKRKVNNKYYLLDSFSKEVLHSGTKEELITKVQEMNQLSPIFMTSREKLDMDLASVSFFQLEEISLPLSSDYIDIFMAEEQ
ncbi:hypothetical protein BGM26_20790 [Bacillus sp. FJAT-29790]|uniref:hypothetical protein n=1 Tax=Bacillus sp. FJAT-29790 TaxID=1895002 RepID=UPI001C224E5E|nr:hypothetical protein [Bacillus sp. FJAT-29790]MBU8881360.1 hypothetical protein [Bacillus sp. FJAT-29790]